MKNIHVLSTDNPSRLRYNLSNNLVLTKEFYRDYGKQVNRNIYITNDEEGDWFIYKNEIIHRDKGDVDSIWIDAIKNGKKIILTTDQDLIKDGVQAIDDEFLEWFVNNPSCEDVEVIYGLYNPSGRKVNFEILNQNHSQCVWKYKVIIPKEEPKQELVKDLTYWKANAEEDYMKVPISVLRYISELENQMCSEEDMKQAFKSGRMVKNYKAEWEETYSDEMTSCKYEDFKQWFEQFKKK